MEIVMQKIKSRPFKKLISMMILIFVLFSFFAICSFISGYQEATVIEGKWISASRQYIKYRGKIDSKGFEQLKKVYQRRQLESKWKVTELKISSSGGSALVGLKMANWVLEENLNVVIEDRCYSACANYVFLAGKNKILHSGAKLGWHGSAIDPRGMVLGGKRYYKGKIKNLSDQDIVKKYKNALESNYMNVKRQFPDVTREEYQSHFIKKLRNMDLDLKVGDFSNADSRDSIIESNKQFYATVNIDPMIANYGFDQIEKSSEKLPNEFYYSLKDLEKMGVKNIVIKDGEWAPDYDSSIFKVDSKYINRMK